MTTEAAQPDMAKMMEIWAKYATPCDGHEHFPKLEGKWDCDVTFWMEPGAPPQQSPGTAEFKTIFGGRYQIQEFTGSAMGQPFEGMGITGFDNYRRQYISIWFDSMGTAIMVSRSTPGEIGDTVNYTAKMDSPCHDAKDVSWRMVARWDGPDRHILEMFCDNPAGGGEYQNMEIIYKRQK